jgi:hypothetical protein
LLLAVGVSAVRSRSRPVAAALLAVILVLNLHAIWAQGSRQIKSDFRSVAAFVEPRRAPQEPLLFLMPYVQHTYRYYAPQAPPPLEGPYTNAGATEEEVAITMEQLTDGHSAVWLISSETKTWDERGLVEAWLRENGMVADSATFTRVSATRFRLDAP